MRSLQELLETGSPAWPLVQEWLNEATSPVEVLPRLPERASDTLLALQVTAHSTLGAIAYETGGILVDHGWVRILGSGCTRMEGDLRNWDGLGGLPPAAETDGLLLVAHDAIGGVFALDGGALGPGRGGAFYFAPDRLEWEDLERGYTDLLHFLLTGDLAGFYREARWPGWEADLSSLSPDQGFHQWPPPWVAEARDSAGKVMTSISRRAVRMRELLLVQLRARAELLEKTP